MLDTDELVELHDKVLRGDGEGKLGIVALVTNLCVSVDELQKTVRSLELALAKAKGWVLGATAVGAAAGSIITFLLEHFVVGAKH
jgi:hypothetical protein